MEEENVLINQKQNISSVILNQISIKIIDFI